MAEILFNVLLCTEVFGLGRVTCAVGEVRADRFALDLAFALTAALNLFYDLPHGTPPEAQLNVLGQVPVEEVGRRDLVVVLHPDAACLHRN